MSCCICIESFNQSKRAKVSCEYCNFEACKTCWKQFLLSIPERARCMNDGCRKKWNYMTLINKFDRTFVDKTYKSHVENIIYNQEKSLLPSAQIIVENEKKCEEYKEKIRQYNVLISQLYAKIYEIDKNPQLNDKQKTFIKKCPNEKCNGFLSTKWNCGLCDTKVCSECHEIKHHDEHKCDPSTLETVKLLKSDSKNCPSCASIIFRISGCDQMFCTNCNTTFDWNTLRIETGVIHNPHYFEWKRKQGTFHEEVQCGRDVDHRFVIYYERLFQSFINNIRHLHPEVSLQIFIPRVDHFRLMCINSIHIRHTVLRQLTHSQTVNNEDLRVKFIKNEIDEQKFKSNIQIRDKKNAKNEELIQIFTMFINAFTDIVYRMEELKKYKDTTLDVKGIDHIIKHFDGIYNEIHKLLEYTNVCLKNVSSIYKCKEMFIDDNLNFNRDKSRYI